MLTRTFLAPVAVAAILSMLSGCMSSNRMKDELEFPSVVQNSNNIKKGFEDQQDQLRGCWMAQRKNLHNRPVAMDIQFRVVREGEVSQVAIAKASARNPAFEQCVKNHVKSFKFKHVLVPPDTEAGLNIGLRVGNTVIHTVKQ